jgi:hypothetical protein
VKRGSLTRENRGEKTETPGVSSHGGATRLAYPATKIGINELFESICRAGFCLKKANVPSRSSFVNGFSSASLEGSKPESGGSVFRQTLNRQKKRKKKGEKEKKALPADLNGLKLVAPGEASVSRLSLTYD